MKERIEKVKTHLSENKATYITGGVSALVGAAGTALFFSAPQTASVSNKISGFFVWKPVINAETAIIQQLSRRGHPGFVVKCVETGEAYASVRRASEVLGLNRNNLRDHLNGLKDSVGGFTFEILGEATK